MADRDVLICGTCSGQFSDLNVFINHKKTCGYVVSSAGSGLETSTILSTPQQTSPVGSQQILLPAGGPLSIVSHPVGLPHVILQTSVGQSQMYRIVLEPSFNSNAQINSNVPVVTQVSQVCSSLHPSSSGVGEIQMTEKQRPVEAAAIPLTEGGSMTRLSSMDPVVTSGWSSQPDQHQTPVSVLNSVDSNVIPGAEKGILGPISVGSSLHTEEEDVATILATQLVSQNPPPPAIQQPPKSKESTILKYCTGLIQEAPVPVETVWLADGEAKSESLVLQEKNSLLLLPEGKSPTKQISPAKSTPRDNDVKEETEPVSRVKEKMLCSYESCNFFTVRRKDMIRHIRKHTGEKPYKCLECGNEFSRSDKLKVHRRTHSKEKPHACSHPGCSYRGSEKAHLTKHYRTHTDERPYKCQFCPYGAKDGSQLTVHLRSHTGDTPFHCQVEACSAVFKTSSDLKRHEKLHTGEKPFKCSDCGYASAFKANLKVHFRNNHSKGEKFGCSTCAFLATSRKELKDHERVHNGRLLRYPQRVKSTPPQMGTSEPPRNAKCEASTHFRAIVRDVPEKRFPLSKAKRCSKPSCPKNYRCEKCGSGFVRKDSYRSHIRQHEQKGKGSEGAAPCAVSRVTIHGSELESQKAKTLNYVLQDEGADCIAQEILLQKEAMKTSENLPVTRCSVEMGRTPPTVSSILSAATPDAFSCIFTFDGISTIQANPVTPTKTTTQSHHQLQPLVETLQSQNSPIIHVLSPANPSAVSHSVQYQQS